MMGIIIIQLWIQILNVACNVIFKLYENNNLFILFLCLTGVHLWLLLGNQCRYTATRPQLHRQKDGQGLLPVPRETNEPGAVHWPRNWAGGRQFRDGGGPERNGPHQRRKAVPVGCRAWGRAVDSTISKLGCADWTQCELCGPFRSLSAAHSDREREYRNDWSFVEL